MRRVNGEGTWGKKTIKGIEYIRYRKKYDGVGYKDFYGKTQKEVKEKIKNFETNEYKTLIEFNKQPEIFFDYMKNWLKNVKTASNKKPLARTTIDAMWDILNLRVKNYPIANMQLEQITPSVCEDYVQKLIDSKYAKATISKAIRLVKQCLVYAYENGATKEDMSKHLYIPSEDVVITKKKEIPFLPGEDMEKLYVEAKRKSKEGFTFGKPLGNLIYGNNGYAIIFIMYTGIRVGEFRELRWKDINLEEKYITINRSASKVRSLDDPKNKKEIVIKTPKTKKSIRVIPLCDRALECVEYFSSINPNHTDEDLFALNTAGSRIDKDNLRRSLNIMLPRSGASVKSCGLHSLRHSFGSFLLIEQEVDVSIVSTLLGHSKISTTYDIYIHVLEQQKMKAVKIFDNIKRED